MSSSKFQVYLILSLVSSSLCVIPEGEIQIGPVFGKGNRLFGGNKFFEVGFEKGGDLKHLLAKKALIGAGVIGAGAVAAGSAALIAKKFPHFQLGWGWSGGSQGYGAGYGQSVPISQSYGWGANGNQQSSGGYYQQPTGSINFQQSSYPTPSSSYYPSTQYGYPEQNDWQVSSGAYGGSLGWSR